MRNSKSKSKRPAGLITRYASTFLVVCLVALLLFSNLSRTVSAAAGLDPSFGSGGKVTTDFAGRLDQANAVAIQSDGKIVVVGNTAGGFDVPALFALARYNPDGSLDLSFGPNHDGRVVTNVSGVAAAVAIQSDAKIVVAGSAVNGAPGNNDFAIVRLDANGNLDATFGANGVVLTDFSGGFDQASAVAIQPADAKLVLAGTAYDAAAGNYDFGLARYSSDGSLDVTFGPNGNGTVLTNLYSSSSMNGTSDFASDLAIQPTDGKIVVTGSALVRYNSDGSLDTTFGFNQNGIVALSQTFGSAVAIQTGDRAVVAGRAFNFQTGRTLFALARYDANGILDSTFGTDGTGLVFSAGLNGEAYGVAIQGSCKIVAAGFAFSAASGRDFAVVSYDANGVPDPNFGPNGNGALITDFVVGDTEANALAIQPDGKIVVAGWHRFFNSSTQTTQQDFALMRYEGGGGPAGGPGPCPANITVPNDPGQGGAVVNYPAPIASNACGGLTTCTHAPGSFFPIGTTTVNCTSGCSFNVTVEDTEAPTITSCPADRTLSSVGCLNQIPDLTRELTAVDNFTPTSSLTVTQSPAPGTRVDLGDVSVMFTVRDGATNSSTCSARMTFADRTPPGIVYGVSGRTPATFVGCQAFIPDLTGEVVARDCSPPITITQSPAAGTPIAAETATTVTVEDAFGNVSTSTTTVTVPGDADCDGIEDSIDLNRSTAADESQIFSNDFRRRDFTPASGISDGATGPTFGTIVDRGGWNVGIARRGSFGVLAGINGAGTNTNIQACDKPEIVQLNSSGQRVHISCEWRPNSFYTRSFMRVEAVAVRSTPIEVRRLLGGRFWLIYSLRSRSGFYFGSPATADPENEGPIPIRITDEAGNTIASMELAPGQTVDINEVASGGVVVTNNGPSSLLVWVQGVGDKEVLPGGATCINLNGNLPNFGFPLSNISASTEPGNCSANINVPTPSAFEGCDNIEIVAVGVRSDGKPLTDPYPSGETTITWTATNAAGQQSSIRQRVIVHDDEAPHLTCPAPITVAATSPAGAVVTFSPTATDNCGQVSVYVGGMIPPFPPQPVSGSTFPIGTTTVDVEAYDPHLLRATCSFTVTVLSPRDTVPNVFAEMVALRGTVTNRRVGQKLDRAISDLSEALDAGLWLDSMHLPPGPAGRQVFHQVREAVNKLHNLIESERDSIPDEVLQGFINRLVGATRLLAVVAINDATAEGGSQRQIARAREELADGDSDVAAGQYGRGVARYREAWKLALRAVDED